MNQHFCHWDMSSWPSGGYCLEFNEKECCGAPASLYLKYPDIPGAWLCADHYDEWMHAQKLVGG
jgi:hypothetical protein